MGDEEELLELGSRRFRSPAARIAAVLLLAATAGGYVLLHDRPGASSRQQAGPSVTTATTPRIANPAVTSEASGPAVAPWPQRAGACGSTAFLPLVSAHRLDRRTGARVIVGDRLASVNVDTGAVRPAAGLARDEYASQIVTTGTGTYALVQPCGQPIGTPARVVRVSASGAVQQIARGPYENLVGGDRPWAVWWDEAADGTSVDALDGSRLRRLPATFGPIAGWHGYLIGTQSEPGSPLGHIRGLDPRTGAVRLDLGPATAVTVGHGVVVWNDASCPGCRLHVFDLATGRRTVVRSAQHLLPSVWGGVVSPDGHVLAVVRESATPGPYEMEHPSNPNEIITVDLTTGTVTRVPGLRLWAKSMPGLDFSADSRWLLISVDEGTGTRLLLWHEGLGAVRQSPARLTTPVAYAPGLATVR